MLITLREALDHFLLLDRAPATIRTYRYILTTFIDAIGPERPLHLIRPEDVHFYISQMRQQRPPLSSVTLRNRARTIKRFFAWCVESRHWITENPAQDLIVSVPTPQLGQNKSASDAEFRAVLAAAFRPRDRAVILLLAESGCRAGEAAGLRMRNLDVEKREAHIVGKGGKRRTIWFGVDAALALDAWLEVRPKTDHDCVFTSQRGKKPLLPSSISRIVNRCAQRAGLDRPLHAHSFRHRVGLTFARRGISPRVAQAYLGHEDVTITMQYYTAVEESDLRAAGELLAANPPPRNWQDEAREKMANRRKTS